MVDTKAEILIVDDEPIVCDLLNEALTDQGYLCTTASDGPEALAKLERQDFDLVLLDIKLPGISGMEVLSKIRSNHPNIATIMVTGVNSADTMVEALRLGALDYVMKPLDIDEVNANIRNLLETKKQPLEKTAYQTDVYPVYKNEDKQVTDCLRSEMNAATSGVWEKLDLLVRQLQIVTGETLGIARLIGIPEDEIINCVATRATFDPEMKRVTISELPKRKIGQQRRFERASIDNLVHHNSVGDKGTILVIDDDELIQSLFREILQEMGHRVMIAGNGIEALDLVKRWVFDLVFLDLNLPAIDGAQFLGEIKKIKPKQPVVIITGCYDNSDLMAPALEYGPCAVMKKPFGEKDVITAVTSFLRVGEVTRVKDSRLRQAPSGRRAEAKENDGDD